MRAFDPGHDACSRASPAAAETFKCPKVGGTLAFGQEANVNSLDQMTSNTISTRNIAMNVFEALMTRDENNNPILDLADSMVEAPDHMTYTFKLRPGVKFHNGKPMTSADVAASWDRYSKVGLDRQILGAVASWEGPDPVTFVVHMKQAQPTFVEKLSSFSIPMVIVPAEEKDDPPQQLHPVGTGPWQVAEAVPGSFVTLKRYRRLHAEHAFRAAHRLRRLQAGLLRPGHVPHRDRGRRPRRRARDGRAAGGRGRADHVGRAAEGQQGRQAAAAAELVDPDRASPMPARRRPTTSRCARRSRRCWTWTRSWMPPPTATTSSTSASPIPNQPDYVTTGKDTYNQKDPAKAKKLLAEAGYKGQPVVLLTNKDYSSMYNAALVVQEQLKAVGINAEIKVVDWPTSVQMSQKADSGWNLFFSGWGTQPALGALATMAFLAPPGAQYMPKNGKDDPDVLAAWRDMNNLPTKEERQAAFGRMQEAILEKAYVFPFGSLTKVQATRANVEGWVPFRIPRMSNVWFTN